MLNISQLNVAELLWRRKWSVIVPVLLGAAAAVIAFRTLPPIYRATTTIMVEAQQVPDAYVKSTVSTSTKERLETIEQQLSSRAPLRLIIEELELYPEEQGRVPEQLLIRRARQSLSVKVARGGVFSIGFTSADPQKAAAAANRVADLFIQENLRLRESQAQNTSAFLDSEAADLKQKVEAQQDRLLAFTRQHEGELPKQEPLIMQAINQLEGRLDVIRGSIQNAEMKMLVLEANADRPLPKVEKPKESPRLATLRAEKERLLLLYTEKHPDVMAVQAEIDAVEAQEAERRSRKAARNVETALETETAETGTDLETLSQVVDDTEAALIADGTLEVSTEGIVEPDDISEEAGEEVLRPSVQAEIDKLTTQIERLEQARENVMNNIAAYQARLERIPRVAQEFGTLQSEYSNVSRKLRSMQAKQLEAQLAENLERSQQAEQFRILDRAIPPLRPYFPNLLLLLGIGIALGGFVGVSIALLREQADETFLDSRSLRRSFPGVDITASIPKIPEAAPSKLGLRKRRIA